MTKIGIIEDDAALRKNLEYLFHLTDEFKVVFSISNIEKILANLDTETPSFIFLDINLPGISGLDGLSVLKKKYPESNIILISGESENDIIWKGLSNGAKGYLIKPISFETIKEQIEIIQKGGAFMTPEVAKKLLDKVNTVTEQKTSSQKIIGLTKKENEVVQQVIKGLSYKEVSIMLSISYSTVNDHLKNIYKKMNVNSKSELICKILENQ
jgi:DNA-binding NarL/FixJ family response regulator